MTDNAIEYREDDYKTLHIAYVQLMSRVATGDFLKPHYVCSKALDSIFVAFTSIRQAMLDHMCIRATDIALDIMNIIRPFIGKWNEQRNRLDRMIRDPQVENYATCSGNKEFVQELKEIQVMLRKKCAEIKEILLAQGA